jgi:thiamine biosynthesis lipoprotein
MKCRYKAIKVPQEVFDLVQRSIKNLKLTLVLLTSAMPQWIKFEIGSMTGMPTPEEIKKSVASGI